MKRIEVYSKPIYVVADVHGAFDIFEKYINHNELSDCVNNCCWR